MRPLPTNALVLLGAALAACKATAPVPAASSGQTLLLPYQQQVVLPAEMGGTSLLLNEVSDSRCPDGGQCIWAGEARVALVVTQGLAAPQTLRLRLGAGPRTATTLPDSVSLTLHQQLYWLRLLAISPYPSLAGARGPVVATLRLRPQ